MKISQIVKENGKWFAEVINSQNTLERYHTGNLYGWDGLSYNELKKILCTQWGFELPLAKDLVLIKKTRSREIYIVEKYMMR